jgi:hypothetical protein
MLPIELGRLERDPVLRRVTREVILRAIWPVIGSRIVRRQQRYAAGKSFPAQHLGGREARSPATHDHHALAVGAAGLARFALSVGLDLFPHEDFAVALFHAPTRHRIERRRPDRLASAQAEARMMPRASHGVVDQQAVRERPAIVRASRADGAEFVAAAREQDGLFTHVSAEHGSLGKAIERDALREVGSGRL